MLRSDTWSLGRRQLVVLISSLTLTAMLLGVGGSWYISGFAERTSDRVLRASVSSIAETVAIEGGKVTLEVPPGAFGMLEDSARDNVYYSVSSGLTTITGYPSFPIPEIKPAPDETTYRYGEFLGQPVRIATQARYLPRTSQPVVVQVAETLDERRDLTRRMLIGLAVLETLMIVVAAVLMRPAVRWGISPLTRLQKTIEARDAGRRGFQPIDVTGVPQELRSLVGTFNTLLARLDNAVRRTREFTGDASHQMRTPLAALRTHLLLLKREYPADLPGHQSLAEVEGAAVRLQRLLSQLLALARSDDALDLGRHSVPPIDLTEVAIDAARDLAPQAIGAGIEIHFEANGPIFAAANPLIVAEMVTNLTDNAIRYNHPGGNVTVRTSADPEGCYIDVEDDGPGIPLTEREAAFGRFYRLQRDHDTNGSGLGLAIVQSLATAAGAKVLLLDRPSGQGLLARIAFPPLPQPA